MSQKSSYFGRESGRSSTRWFGPSDPPGTEAAQHGRGARAGDGRTSNPKILGKLKVVFRRGDRR